MSTCSRLVQHGLEYPSNINLIYGFFVGISPVILSGGSGTRLWPLSRRMFPKQFINLHGTQTMLQETIGRLDGLDMAAPLVVCNEDHRFIVAEQLRQMGVDQPSILLESVGRNTAPAIALAALHEQASRGEGTLLLVLSADHVIPDAKAFRDAVEQAVEPVREGRLATFGIVPDKAETGYGYIRKGEELSNSIHEIDRFVEKPDQATAEAYLESGDYLWNSGMFLFSAGAFLAELELHHPEILAATRKAMQQEQRDLDFIRVDEEAFAACPAESIDYAVMEKTDRAVVVPLDAGWNDIGSWSALWDVNDKDGQGNSIHGDVLLVDARNNLAMSESRLLAAVGVDDLIMVETKDAVLVAHKDKSQEVKQIVEQLKAAGRPETDFHRVVYRPWGCFDSIEEGERFKVKRISVKPGGKLSLQMHHHRAEHWVVVSGTARVQRGEETRILTENDSIYIHVGEKH
ncbi:MAG TPA: mannose-1-phosphate guanylyltransferase/mannose-6-phosphate isomerase, partial [Desulfobulbaceae bacterium]|nr:mannose-1-phosphate guanylyltransferase/mannose-6-phosphate isomerase [Desulfobulbaceae bacterium]